MGAQTAGVGIRLSADRADVGATVGVTVHVTLEVVLELEAAAAGGATVKWTAPNEHSWM